MNQPLPTDESAKYRYLFQTAEPHNASSLYNAVALLQTSGRGQSVLRNLDSLIAGEIVGLDQLGQQAFLHLLTGCWNGMYMTTRDLVRIGVNQGGPASASDAKPTPKPVDQDQVLSAIARLRSSNAGRLVLIDLDYVFKGNQMLSLDTDGKFAVFVLLSAFLSGLPVYTRECLEKVVTFRNC